MSTPSRKKPIRPALVVAAVAAFVSAGTMTGACGSSDDEYVNCVDDDGVVVDSSYCEDGNASGHYWYYVSRKRHSKGTKVPSGWLSSRINPTDTAARARAGLPSTGNIGGKKISSGGFGKGSSSGKSGGS
ncbi:MAG: hypothetical protein JXA67_02465 [Micromonosporaceae bacterium]|nr:hypothetical protein [Micromonosporaceae bacterium]